MGFNTLSEDLTLGEDAIVVDNSVVMRWILDDGSNRDRRYARSVPDYVMQETFDPGSYFETGHAHGLSAYDCVYLKLAGVHGLPLATLDSPCLQRKDTSPPDIGWSIISSASFRKLARKLCPFPVRARHDPAPRHRAFQSPELVCGDIRAVLGCCDAPRSSKLFNV